jgi:hypothetical protein
VASQARFPKSTAFWRALGDAIRTRVPRRRTRLRFRGISDVWDLADVGHAPRLSIVLDAMVTGYKQTDAMGRDCGGCQQIFGCAGWTTSGTGRSISKGFIIYGEVPQEEREKRDD